MRARPSLLRRGLRACFCCGRWAPPERRVEFHTCTYPAHRTTPTPWRHAAMMSEGVHRVVQMAEMLTPPDPLYLDRSGTLRWAAGQPNGPRFADVERDRRRRQRVRPHPVNDARYEAQPSPNRWRMAFTERAARKSCCAEPGSRADTLGASCRDGTGLAACCGDLDASTTFRGPFAERRTKAGLILWFPAPRPPEHLRFYVLLGEPEAPGGLTVAGWRAPRTRRRLAGLGARWRVLQICSTLRRCYRDQSECDPGLIGVCESARSRSHPC